MTRLFTPLQKFSQSLITVMALLCLIFGSCKKEIYDVANKPQKLQELQWAIDYYQQKLEPNRQMLQLPSRTSNKNQINKMAVIWSRAFTAKTDLLEAVEVPVNIDGKLMPTFLVTKDPNPKRILDLNVINASLNRLYIYKNKGGETDQYFITYVPDKIYLEKHNGDISHNHLSKLDQDFFGYLQYKDWDGNLLFVKRIENGVMVRKIDISGENLLDGTTMLKANTLATINKTSRLQEATCDDYTAIYQWEQWCHYDGDSLIPYACDPAEIISTHIYSNCGGGATASTEYPLELNTDSLRIKFPCADKLIAQPILTSASMSKFVEPFLTPQRPTITYLTDNTLPWGSATTGGTFMLGNNGPDANSRVGLSSIVRLNEKMLQNSSQLLIAATVVHETLHGYINYNIATAQNNYNSYNDSNWMVGLNNFYLMGNLPSNYSNHTMMLEDYFDKSMAVLQAWNAKQGFIYTMKDMASAMLYGLDTYDTGTSQTQINNINAVFETVKTKYSITTADLTTFKRANLIAATNKLSTTGCN